MTSLALAAFSGCLEHGLSLEFVNFHKSVTANRLIPGPPGGPS